MTVVPVPAARAGGGGRHRRRRGGGGREPGGRGQRDHARAAIVSASPREDSRLRLQVYDEGPNIYNLGRLSLDDSQSVSSSPRGSSSPRADTMVIPESSPTNSATTMTTTTTEEEEEEDASVDDSSLSLVASATTTTAAVVDAPPSPTIRESPSSSKLYLKSIQYRLERKKSHRSGQRPDDLPQPPPTVTEPKAPARHPKETYFISEPLFQVAPPSPPPPPSPSPASGTSALRPQRRMQAQLEHSYPMRRENAERRKDKTEQRYLRLSQKAEAYSKNNRNAPPVDGAAESTALASSVTPHPPPGGHALADKRAEPPKAKENYEPPPRRSKRSSIGGGDSTAAGVSAPPSPVNPALPPRPLGRRMPMLPPPFPLHRSRSSSPRRSPSSADAGTATMVREAPPALATERKAARLNRSRSESPAARVPPPPSEAFVNMPLRPTFAGHLRSSQESQVRTSEAVRQPARKEGTRDADGAEASKIRPVDEEKNSPSSLLPPRPQYIRSEGTVKERRKGVMEPDRINSKAIRRTSSEARLSTPSSVASTVLNLGSVAIAQCIAPSLMRNGQCISSSTDRPKPTRDAAAPAPFFLPGVPSSSSSRRRAGGRLGAPEQPTHRETSMKLPSASHALKRASNTREELLKLKDELRKERQGNNEGEAARKEIHPRTECFYGARDGMGDSYQARKQRELRMLHGRRACEKRVRFSSPLVTAIRHRPYTRAEDIDKLYFGEEELEELETDRATVEGDQFEMALVDPGGAAADDGNDSGRCGRARSTVASAENDSATVSVTYTNKRVHRLEEGGDEVPFSPSDDTSFTYYE